MGRPVQGGAIAEVSVIGEMNGQRIMNVWHFRWVGAPTPVEDGDAITTILQSNIQGPGAAGILSRYRAMTNEACNWQSVKYQWVYPIRYSATYGFTSTGPGEVVDPPLPQNCCGVVSTTSMFAGVGGRGRKHFGGLSLSDTAAGEVANQFIVNVTPIMELMKEVIDTAAVQPASSLVPIIYDKVDPTLSIQWTDFSIMDTFRVMRRRTVRVGI